VKEEFCIDGHRSPVAGCWACEDIKRDDPLRYYLHTDEFAEDVRIAVVLGSLSRLRDAILRAEAKRWGAR
jgi:hypothetical protein